MRLLLANPNTTQAITDVVLAEAKRCARPDTELVAATARFGVPYISARSEAALAAHALLELLAAYAGRVDAVVVAAFVDPVVPPARELMPVPVVGLAEAAIHLACLIGGPFAVIGLGPRTRSNVSEMVRRIGLAERCAGARWLDLTGPQLVADPTAAEDAVRAACLRTIEEDGAEALVLGGAAFAGMAERLATELPVPVIAPIRAAVGIAEVLGHAGLRPPQAGSQAAPTATPTSGVDATLTRLFKHDV